MNVTGHFIGRIDSPLTDKGIEQAKKAGPKAKKLGIDYIISSPLSRASKTAKIIAKEIGYPADKIEFNPLLAERSYGFAEGQLYSDVDLDGIADVETVNSLLLRAQEIYEALKRLKADNVLVVSHGSMGRALRQKVLSIPFDGPEEEIANAEIIEWI